MRQIYQIIMGVLLAMGSISAYAGGIVMMGGGVVSSAPPSYLLQEGFEGTGLPTDWTTATGSPDYDSTTHAIVDNQSMYLTNSLNVRSISFTAQSDVYVAVRMKVVANSNNSYQLMCVNSNTTKLGCLGMRYNGKITASVPSNPTISGTATTLSAGNTYYLKFHYTAGTGNATVVTYSSADGQNWTTEATRNDGTGGNADRLSWLLESADGYAFDDIRVSTSDINW